MTRKVQLMRLDIAQHHHDPYFGHGAAKNRKSKTSHQVTANVDAFRCFRTDSGNRALTRQIVDLD